MCQISMLMIARILLQPWDILSYKPYLFAYMAFSVIGALIYKELLRH